MLCFDAALKHSLKKMLRLKRDQRKMMTLKFAKKQAGVHCEIRAILHAAMKVLFCAVLR